MINWYTISQTEEAKWGRFPRSPQREFPFVHEPGYHRKAKPFINEYERDDSWEIDYNLYHVTTNLQGVMSSGRLKSRSELGGDVPGLGGGYANVASNLISVTYDYSRAKKIYDDLKFVCDVVHGKVKATDILNYALDGAYGFEDTRAFNKIIFDYVPKNIARKILTGELGEEEINNHIVGGEDLYNFLQVLEQQVSEYQSQSEGDSLADAVFTVTGFTSSYENMINIDPSNIAILQLVAKKDANPEHVLGEMELRFRPEDLQVLRFIKP